MMKTYADFLVVLSPTELIKDRIGICKNEAAKLIGPYDGLHGIANISIKHMPRQKPFMTAPFIKGLEKTISGMPPVTLTIEGFDFFIHGEEYRTLYAKIGSTPASTQWFKVLKKNLNVREFLVPHITIARNLPVAAFKQLWPRFNSVRWVESFQVNRLTFLQKDSLDNAARWQIFTEMPFEGKIRADEVPEKRMDVGVITQKPGINQQISLF
jgi:hypothetical protein